MQLTKTLVAAIFAASVASAAPTTGEKFTITDLPEWTIESLKRVCAKDDSHCTWTFGINDHLVPTTACKHKVKGPDASHANPSGASTCGDFTVTSGWSGQFGPDNGFTTLSVVNNKHKLITWPAYTDKQVEGGNVVKPDQSYPPVHLG